MWRKAIWVVPLAAVVIGVSVAPLFRGGGAGSEHSPAPEPFPVLDPDEVTDPAAPAGGTELATFGSGCFWCTEAVFQQMRGVQTVVSGYSGGDVANPTYKQVCTGTTGHAEVVQVTFDPRVISYPELLEVFWRSHDPTTRNRQGADVGPQYRSVIFTHTDRQRRLAERYKQRIDAAGVFPKPLVTEIVPFVAFYPAEADHQNYYASNPREPYCRVVIGPKVDKLRRVFQDRLKPGP
jgi:peptide-methionine (S)-S-oxide reductase